MPMKRSWQWGYQKVILNKVINIHTFANIKLISNESFIDRTNC